MPGKKTTSKVPSERKLGVGRKINSLSYGRLTVMQQTFINEYLVDLNGRQAAIRAGYSAKSAHVICNELLRIPLVSEAVRTAMEKRAEKTGITAQWVLQEIYRRYHELVQMNHSDPGELYDDKGNLKPIQEWPEIWRQKQMIKAFEVQEEMGKVMVPVGKGKDKRFVYRKQVTGMIKKVMSADLKAAELQLLKMLGQHVDIRAFDTEKPFSGEVKIKVEFTDAPIKASESNADHTITIRPNGSKPNGSGSNGSSQASS